MKIAVIGSGISGLSAAYFLSKRHKVDLFEKNDHFGGHSYTVDAEYEKDKKIFVDVGFIVFNHLTYPNLINFFNELKVPYEKSDMSFSVSVKDSTIEYGGTGFNALFARKNGLDVHAGHGITYKSAYKLSKIKYISEFNIGHFVISESLFIGLDSCIKKFKKIINS